MNRIKVCALFLTTYLFVLSTSATELVSISTSGQQGNDGYLLLDSISQSGRYVVFSSRSSNLVINDNNGFVDVFVHDRNNRITELVSVSSTGEQANSDSGSGPSHIGTPTISANGRFISFWSSATNLADNDTNNSGDIFVRDRQTGITERVSITSTGEQQQTSGFPLRVSKTNSISADGRFVSFSSNADNLAANNTGEFNDIYVHDRQTGITEKASVSSTGEQANKGGSSGYLSSNGRFVVFTSQSSNLVENDTNTISSDVFVRDRQAGTTERVSISSSGEQANSFSRQVSITADGRFVVFTSSASNLVDDDSNDRSDIFIHDRQSGLTEVVSVSSSGALGSGSSSQPSISSDGRYVTFESASFNLVELTGSSDKIFIHDRVTQKTKAVVKAFDNSPVIGFTATPLINQGGSQIGFISSAQNLVENDLNGTTFDIYLSENPFKINLLGQPQINRDSESGVYIWRTIDDKTIVQIVAGGSQEYGEITDYKGMIIAESTINSLQPIGLEPSDSLNQTSNNKIEFNLLVQRPWEDRFSFVVNTDESLCVIISNYAGGLFLGPDKIKVSVPFDIHNQMGCDKSAIPVDGAPSINQAVDKGWFIWLDNGVWVSRFVSGGTGQRFIGSLQSSQAMSNLTPISIEPNDKVVLDPASELNFNLYVASPYQDGFRINIPEIAKTCIALEPLSGFNIFLGPERISMPDSFDLNTLGGCDSALSITTKGNPIIDRTLDNGIFLWETDKNNWQAEVVSASGARLININLTSSKIIRNVKTISIESNDVFTIAPFSLDLSLRVRPPWYDGFSFLTDRSATSCLSSSAITMPIYIGPDRLWLGQTVDLNTLRSCP